MKLKKERKTLLERAAGETKWHYLIQSLGELILGIVLIALPQQRVSILCIAMGALLMIYGGINIYLFVVNNWTDVFGGQMIYGVILTAIGLAFLTRQDEMIMLTSVVFGILILIDSIIDLRRALLFREAKRPRWYILMILAFVTAVFGTLFIVRPELFGELLMIVIGVLLIYEAVSTLVLLFVIGHLKDNLATAAPTGPVSGDSETGTYTPAGDAAGYTDDSAFLPPETDTNVL